MISIARRPALLLSLTAWPTRRAEKTFDGRKSERDMLTVITLFVVTSATLWRGVAWLYEDPGSEKLGCMSHQWIAEHRLRTFWGWRR